MLLPAEVMDTEVPAVTAPVLLMASPDCRSTEPPVAVSAPPLVSVVLAFIFRFPPAVTAWSLAMLPPEVSPASWLAFTIPRLCSSVLASMVTSPSLASTSPWLVMLPVSEVRFTLWLPVTAPWLCRSVLASMVTSPFWASTSPWLVMLLVLDFMVTEVPACTMPWLRIASAAVSSTFFVAIRLLLIMPLVEFRMISSPVRPSSFSSAPAAYSWSRPLPTVKVPVVFRSASSLIRLMPSATVTGPLTVRLFTAPFT